MEAARAFGQRRTPYAAMSRGVSGFIDRSLVITLPGSRGGASESMAAILPALVHIFDVCRDLPHQEVMNELFWSRINKFRSSIGSYSTVEPRAVQTLPLVEAHQHYLAHDVLSEIALPLFTQSAVDGYALKSEDILAVLPVFELVGEIRAVLKNISRSSLDNVFEFLQAVNYQIRLIQLPDKK